MSGNVYEYCQDWYDSDYYSISPSKNPRGPANGSDYVIRGGCCSSSSEKCRVAHRTDHSPDRRVAAVGFRLAMDAELTL